MPKVNLNSKEYLEDSYPKRDKVTKWRFDWHSHNGVYNKTCHLDKYIHSQVDKPYDDVYSEVCRRIKTDKSLKAINKAPYFFDMWFKPHAIDINSHYVWNERVYLNTDGILRRGDFFNSNESLEKVLLRFNRIRSVSPNYLKKLKQKEKLERRNKAIERYCQKSQKVVDSFIRIHKIKKYWSFFDTRSNSNRYLQYYYTIDYAKIVKQLETLNQFYDLPYRFVDAKGNVLTNVIYKRYMK